MFCWKCGKELSENARFCTQCGAPADNAEGVLQTAVQIEETAQFDTFSHNVEASASGETVQISVTEPAEETSQGVESAGTDKSTEIIANPDNMSAPVTEAQPDESAAASAPDLIIRKKRISITGNRLLINGIYYRKKDSRRFKKKKGQLSVPLSYVSAVSVQHTPCAGRIIASILLFAIFTAGTAISGFFCRQSWNQLKEPYQQERIQELEDILDRLASSDASQLDDLESQLQSAVTELTLVTEQLEELKEQRREELLHTAITDPSFDTHALLSIDFFADAYQQYLEDLLDAFLNDSLIHDWLYPYYAYSMELGSNRYIENELYFYTVSDADSIFSYETENPKTLLQNAYNYDLDRHIYYTGRIYITASDFLNRVLNVPDYVANGAVFVKAYGGTPYPANMHVPGWSNADYAEFWRDAPSYFDSSDPVWIYYDLSAENFNIDWGNLASEQAFYDAYLKFMDTIAPDLGVFDMVTYSAGDDSYGGMYYEITGREASVTEIVTYYIEEHPEYLEEIGLDPAAQLSSYDEQLTTLEENIEELTDFVAELTNEQNELAAFFDSADSVRAEHGRLMADAGSRGERLVQNLAIFGSIFVLLLLMAIISLIVSIRLVKKPKHLMLLELTDGTEAAFSISFCSKKKLQELQDRLTRESIYTPL